MTPSLLPSGSFQQGEAEFDCGELQGVWVRFSDPGYIERERVGLFAKYEGVAAEQALLRIWWDYENGNAFQDVLLGPEQVKRRVGDRYDFEILVEHAYTELNGRADLTVRTEFILLGRNGNCPRNRHITVTPSSVEKKSGSAGGPVCGARRFCDLGDGTVLDTSTGLTWLKDAGCFVFPRTWVTATELAGTLASGQCGLSDGSSAGSWRLPTRAELIGLLDSRFNDPRLSNTVGNAQWSEGDAFLRVRSRIHWTSEESDACISELHGAWFVNVGNGASRCLAQILPAFFWPVR